jgi:uncharacterized HAD superfamily protein
MHRTVIAFDFDDVLMPFNMEFVPYHNRLHGTCLMYEDIVSFNTDHVYQCDIGTFTERVHAFYRSPEHADAKPDPDTCEAVRALADRYTLDIVTSRPESIRDYTDAWLQSVFPGMFRTLHCTNSFGAAAGVKKRSKSEVCREIGASVLIEDLLENAEDVARSGIPVLLPDRPWNSGLVSPGIIRIRSLSDAVLWIDANV